jgi:hypothetical protein
MRSRPGIRFTQVILTDAEWATLERCGTRQGVSVTRLIREIVLERVEAEERRRAKRRSRDESDEE